MTITEAVQQLVDSGIDAPTADALIAQTWNWNGLRESAQAERIAWYIEDQAAVRQEHAERAHRAQAVPLP